MAKTKPAIARQLPVTPEALTAAATEYLAFKSELERVTLKTETLKAFLKAEMSKLATPEVLVSDEILYLCPTQSKSFDLGAAKETLSPTALKKLEPFIKVTESFEIKAAEQVAFDLSKYEKFITVKETVQLRTKKLKGEE